MSHYDAAKIEQKWLANKKWLGSFDSQKCKTSNTFEMIMPPPNITSILHIGHALTLTIQDTISRYQRQIGKEVNWIPGLDHAGIATQNVVEKYLQKQNKTSNNLVDEIWRWKAQYGDNICKQITLMGVSCNWAQQYFTLDQIRSNSVKHAFKILFDQNLIYRSDRIVNWSCSLKTAISDVEVDTKQILEPTNYFLQNSKETVEFGVMHLINYRIVNCDEVLTISTTRPETIFADVAVAVHPNDTRYQHLIGKKLIHPYCDDRDMIIIADEIAQPDKGFGCVKISPAHDKDDFDCAIRHNLPNITILNNDGTLKSNVCKNFAGLDRLIARQQIVEDLKLRGLYQGKNNHEMTVNFCSRSGDIIEPILTKQWFLKTSHMAARANQLVQNNEIVIIPDLHKKTWNNWLSSCQDWCISRQLLWGHKIPAFCCEICDSDNWICAVDDIPPVCAKCHQCMQQSSDVLDTWFSSALLPLSVKNWPNNSSDVVYTTDIVETGSDILFFWVARMVMLCVTLTDQIPFNKILFHTMVRDKFGKKMSKSSGNVIDPIDLIHGASLEQLHKKIINSNISSQNLQNAMNHCTKEYPNGIQACGADALRFCLLSYASQTEQINLDVSKLYSCKHMCDKIWQACNYVKLQVNKLNPSQMKALQFYQFDSASSLLSTDWILKQIFDLDVEIKCLLKDYKFGQISKCLQQFWINTFCDTYIENTKMEFGNDDNKIQTCAALILIAESFLKLLHPLMPFITEELNEQLSNLLFPNEEVKFLQICDRREHMEVLRDQNININVEVCFKQANTIIAAIKEEQISQQINSSKINKLMIWKEQLSACFNDIECAKIYQHISENLGIEVQVLPTENFHSVAEMNCRKIVFDQITTVVYFTTEKLLNSNSIAMKVQFTDLVQSYFKSNTHEMISINKVKIEQFLSKATGQQTYYELLDIFSNLSSQIVKNIQSQIDQLSNKFDISNMHDLPKKIQTKLGKLVNKLSHHSQLQNNMQYSA